MNIHIVKIGETIESIANTYGISTERLISINGLFNLPDLVAGQALLILIPDVTHRVQPGETIYSIAEYYGVTPMELLQKNPSLILRQEIYPDEELVITYMEERNKPISIYGYVYPAVQNNVLRRALPFASKCAIFGYGFRADGSLIPINDEKIIEACLQYQTEPIMLITSIDESGGFGSGIPSLVFNDINLQNVVIANMLTIMAEKGYTGLDIDFEYIDPNDRDAFTAFVANTTRQMNANGYTVNVDLAPKTSSTQQGTLYEGHDYRALGNAANTVLVMSYEWGYTYGPPMAVAPLPQVRQVVSYAVTEIPSEKIYMGIPNYGYDWRLPFERGISRADSIGNEQAILIAYRNNVQIQFDEIAQTPFFEYRDLAGVDHIVWFEDIRSIQKKFQLIDEFNLLGGGYWNLMRPFNQNWSFLGTQYDIDK